MTARTITELARLTDETTVIRVMQSDFQEMLLDNLTVDVNEDKRFLQGINIGEGVFMVKLLPKGWDKTFGTILLDPKTEWIVKGTGLALKKTKCCNSK